MRHLFSSRTVLMLAVVAVGASTAAVARATMDSPAPAVISGCYDKHNGAIRVLLGKPCRKGEIPISWNATGVQGAKGDPGLPGAVGTTGTPGLERRHRVERGGWLHWFERGGWLHWGTRHKGDSGSPGPTGVKGGPVR